MTDRLRVEVVIRGIREAQEEAGEGTLNHKVIGGYVSKHR